MAKSTTVNPATMLSDATRFSELRQRFIFLIGALVVYRIGTFIPVPGINPEALEQFFQQQSGTILTMEMATAMNRSVANILFAGFGGAPAAGAGDGEERPHTSIGAQDAAIKLAYADSVVIVPGYGLAVAQAQNHEGSGHEHHADELQATEPEGGPDTVERNLIEPFEVQELLAGDGVGGHIADAQRALFEDLLAGADLPGAARVRRPPCRSRSRR